MTPDRFDHHWATQVSLVGLPASNDVDFLVKVDSSRAYALPENERQKVTADERRVGCELMARDVLRHIWRLPGTRANIGIWSASNADELEEVLTSLPIWPYADIEVTALVTHPLVTGN